ncbi:hypothetical protein Hanom_Chr03g00183871 [Helianthus anomalus]
MTIKRPMKPKIRRNHRLRRWVSSLLVLSVLSYLYSLPCPNNTDDGIIVNNSLKLSD